MPDAGRVHAVVLAGGSGQRFWPISRELSPKQLLSLFGTESLIAQAIHRIMPVLDGACADVLVVTNERLVDEIREHLESQPDAALGGVEYLVEPVGRNTAPALALACAHIVAEDPEAIVVVLPSDHVLDAGPAWFDALASAIALARDGYFATIGVKPATPHTGYGYIKVGEPCPSFTRGGASAFLAADFAEKPDEASAARYVAEGYLWNAGVFVMRASGFLAALAAVPETAPIERAARAVAGTADVDVARAVFGALPSVSIDVAVMERSDRVAVVAADVGWSDVGTLAALTALATPDEAGNARTGRGVDVNSASTTVYAPDRLVATLGVSDLIVVDTWDATLIAHKDSVQDIRLVVEALRAAGADEIVQPRTSIRSWGTWTTLLDLPGCRVKEIDVKPGSRVSMQRHVRRSETWVVGAGRARVTRDGETTILGVGESAFVEPGCVHRIENDSDATLRVIEVQIGEYLGEDDVERIQDDPAHS